MLGQQFATILGQTDPFDVAQGLERHIRAMDGAQIRALIQAAAPRMNDWYRSEFLPLVDESDDERLRVAFAHSLKSNLRAIPLFGPNFCQAVIARIPGDRTIGLGEEGQRIRLRPVAFGIIALALLIGGAAAEHVISTARANANTPVVLMTPEPLAPVAAASAAPQRTVATATPARRTVPAPAKRTPPPAAAPTAATALAKAPAPAPVQPLAAAPAPAPRVVHAAAVRAKRTPPAGSGVKTIIAQEATPRPTPEPTPVDVSDMPQAYSDATPLPANAAPTAAVVTASALHVPTPTPGPNHSWTHRLVHAAVHLVNSTLTTVGVAKRPPQPTPSPSPSGPRP